MVTNPTKKIIKEQLNSMELEKLRHDLDDSRFYGEAMSHAHTNAMIDLRTSNIAFAELLEITPSEKIREAFAELWELKNK